MRAEQAVVYVSPIMLATGPPAEFDLEQPLTELFEMPDRRGQGDAGIILGATIDIPQLAKSPRRKRPARFMAVCDHRGQVNRNHLEVSDSRRNENDCHARRVRSGRRRRIHKGSCREAA